MVGRRGLGADSCSRVLNQLELMEGIGREAERKRVAVT